jgi:hypothetical protein
MRATNTSITWGNSSASEFELNGCWVGYKMPVATVILGAVILLHREPFSRLVPCRKSKMTHYPEIGMIAYRTS